MVSLILVILFWYKNGASEEIQDEVATDTNKVSLKLFTSLVFLVFAAWLITYGAKLLLYMFSLCLLFIGYSVRAFGTLLQEISASVSLALKGRYETVSGTSLAQIYLMACVF